jgi:hypothetical protein
MKLIAYPVVGAVVVVVVDIHLENSLVSEYNIIQRKV